MVRVLRLAVIVQVTGIAQARCPGVTVGMAGGTFRGGMRTGQRKISGVVVKIGAFPTGVAVAL